MLIYVAHITNCFHAIHSSIYTSIHKWIVYKIFRHFSFTPYCLQLFLCMNMPHTNRHNFFFWKSLSLSLTAVCRSLFLSHSCCLCLFVKFFRLSFARKKNYYVLYAADVILFFFSSMPMAFYYGFFSVIVRDCFR